MSSSPAASSPVASPCPAGWRAAHDALRAVFARYRTLSGRGAPANERLALAELACAMVERHASIGAAPRRMPCDAPTGPRAIDPWHMTGIECETGLRIIRQLRATDPGEPRFDALVVALGQCVERRLLREEVLLLSAGGGLAREDGPR
jgi:hypothetical protein